MKAKFRKAVYEDLENIIELCNECFEENTSLDYAQNIFLETEKDPNHIYLVGIIDEKIIAHAKITIIPTIYEKMNTYAILNHVCVSPQYRRHNIATQMLEEIEKICQEKNCVCMELWSNNYRVAAHACYKKYGFVPNDATFFSKKVG